MTEKLIMRFAVYLVGNASAMFKAAVICVALIRAFGTYTCEFVRVTEICSTNTTCADRPAGSYNDRCNSTYVAASKGRWARVTRRYGALVTTAQLPNCITAAGNLGVSLAGWGYFPRGFLHDSAVSSDTSVHTVFPCSQER